MPRSVRGLQSMPLAVDGVLYYSGSYNQVFALDGATGEVLWYYQQKLNEDLVSKQTHSPYNRGLAVGFGAQTLVKDVISGFFLILEDQVRVGDVAVVNGTGGSVEQINMRTIVLRDMEGTVHVIPNGEIRTLANRSKDFSYYVIDIGVSYDDDTDRIVEVVKEAARELMQDPAYTASILEPLEVLGVDEPCRGRCMTEHGRIEIRAGVDDNIGGGKQCSRTQGDQIRSTGSGPDEMNGVHRSLRELVFAAGDHLRTDHCTIARAGFQPVKPPIGAACST